VNCDAVGKPDAKRWYMLDLALFGGFTIAYAGFWGINSLIRYLDGLSNGGYFLLGPLVFFGLGTILLVWLLVLPIRMLKTWPEHIRHRGKLTALCTLTLVALVAWLALPFMDLELPGHKTFMDGFRQYMQKNADLDGIRSWLNTLDPNVCTREPIDLYGTYSSLKSHWPETMAWPAAITRFDPHYVEFMKTGSGRLKIRLTWGGALGHWGVEIGPEDMDIPPTAPTRKVKVGASMVNEYGEYRLPLAPGAYVWHEIQ